MQESRDELFHQICNLLQKNSQLHCVPKTSTLKKTDMNILYIHLTNQM